MSHPHVAVRTGLVSCLASVLFVMLCVQGAHAQQLTFSDSTFNLANWSAAYQYFDQNTAGNDPIIAYTQETSGGNPGDFMQVEYEIGPAGSGNSFGRIFLALDGATWDPSEGLITTLDFSMDRRVFTDTSLIVSFAIRQGDTVYIFTDSVAPASWTTLGGTDLLATNFARAMNANNPSGDDWFPNFDTNSNPDFSATGDVLQFGIFVGGGGSTATPVIRTVGIDNWTVTLNGIPEPASMALLGLGSLLILGRNRRRVA